MERSPAIPLEAPSLWTLLEARVAATPDRMMVIDTKKKQLSFKEFLVRCERVAAGLQDLGISEGTRVAWQLPTTIETIILSMALSRLGALQIPIIHIYRQRELHFIVTESKADFLLTRSTWRGFDYSELAADVARSIEPSPQLVVVDDIFPDGDPSTLADHPSTIDAATGAPLVRWFYYTSGTTSAPKGVQHSDQTLIAGALALVHIVDAQPDDLGSIAFPFAHIGGPDYLGMVLASGMGVVVVEAFDPAEALRLYEELGVTLAGGTTVFYTALLQEHRRHPENEFLPSLRALVGGGAPKPSQIYYECLEELGVPVLHGWAMTECPMLCCGAVIDSDEQRAHSEGAPVRGADVKVVDPGADGVGRLYVRGTMLFHGYVDPVLNKGVFDDGWFDSGDLGYLRPDGHVVIAGRGKDVIIRKGETISAKEIEDILYRHPKVADVAVIGVVDTSRGERVCAVVQLVDAHDSVTLEELGDFCRAEGLINQKVPEQIEVLARLPRNATGKIAKNQLRQQFSGMNQQS